MKNSIFRNIDDLYLFCTVVEAGSLSKAAERLNEPVSTLSRRLTLLEKRLGMTLLQTSRRELVATQAGEKLFDTLASSLWFIDNAVGRFQQDLKTLNGLVRVTVPRAFYYDVVRHVIEKMFRDFPQVHFEVTVSQFADEAILERSTDIAMVFNLEKLGDCIARPLYRTKLGFFAHRSFFENGKVPDTLEELAQYPWVNNYASRTISFFKEDQLVDTLDVNLRYVINDIHSIADAVRAGLGVGAIPLAKAKKHQEIMRIFPELNSRIRQAYLVYPRRRYQSLAVEETVRRLEEAATKWAERYDDWL